MNYLSGEVWVRRYRRGVPEDSGEKARQRDWLQYRKQKSGRSCIRSWAHPSYSDCLHVWYHRSRVRWVRALTRERPILRESGEEERIRLVWEIEPSGASAYREYWVIRACEREKSSENLFFTFLVCIPLLCYDKDSNDEPIESDSERNKKCWNGDRERKNIEHHIFHHVGIECDLWHFFTLVFWWRSFFFCAGRRRIIWEWEPRLNILQNSEYSSNNSCHHSTGTEEIDSKKMSIDQWWIESRKKRVQVVYISFFGNTRNHPIQSYQYWHLYEKWQARPQRRDSLFFIQIEHLHAESCLIVFIFFLEFFDFWLDHVHFFLTLEHVLLRHEENESDNDREYDNRPSKWMTGEPRQYPDKKIVNRVIKESRHGTSECSWGGELEVYNTISDRSFCSDDIISWFCLKELAQGIERDMVCLSRTDTDGGTKFWSNVRDTLNRYWVYRQYHISTRRQSESCCAMVRDVDFRRIRNHDRGILDREDNSCLGNFLSSFARKKVMIEQKKSERVRDDDKYFLLHRSVVGRLYKWFSEMQE